MIPVRSDVRIWLATGHTDMRRGMFGLALQVRQGLKRDPHAGDLYIFRGKRGDLCKILWHDGVGMSLYAKRLDRGRFVWPAATDGVFKDAAAAAKKVGGRDVAVLCLNENLFDRYRDASRIQGKFVAITSREDLKELQRARSRCVFSMPEYVAGLQFDTVFLIHADQADLADENVGQGGRRRYVSRVYLGASRAQRQLVVATSEERSGRNEILSAPLRNGRIVER